MAPDRSRSTRSEFSTFYQVQTRWMDGDVYGHLNNTVHYSLFDTAVNGWLISKGLLEPHSSETYFLVAESGCRYHAEMHFPSLIEAGLRVANLGNSSIRWEIGLFVDGKSKAAADGFFIHVNVTRDNHRPCPIPVASRVALTGLMTPRPD